VAGRARILLVEDDTDLAEGLGDALRLEGYGVALAGDGKQGLRQALSGLHQLVILDAMLPELSGFDLLKELRRKKSPVPVLMLTARGQEVDKIRGLKQGADDYVTKPFALMELLARVEALLRRAGHAHRPARRFRIGDLDLDFGARRVIRRGRELALTAREMDILQLLAERHGEAVSRHEVLARIWGTGDDVEVATRTVDQHVAALRRKLGDDAASPRIIETVYGYGYRLAG
jgi:DNA-binding response OmpR family regulator